MMDLNLLRTWKYQLWRSNDLMAQMLNLMDMWCMLWNHTRSSILKLSEREGERKNGKIAGLISTIIGTNLFASDR